MTAGRTSCCWPGLTCAARLPPACLPPGRPDGSRACRLRCCQHGHRCADSQGRRGGCGGQVCLRLPHPFLWPAGSGWGGGGGGLCRGATGQGWNGGVIGSPGLGGCAAAACRLPLRPAALLSAALWLGRLWGWYMQPVASSSPHTCVLQMTRPLQSLRRWHRRLRMRQQRLWMRLQPRPALCPRVPSQPAQPRSRRLWRQ